MLIGRTGQFRKAIHCKVTRQLKAEVRIDIDNLTLKQDMYIQINFGVLWCSLVFFGVLWCSLAFFGVLWCFLVFFGVRCFNVLNVQFP